MRRRGRRHARRPPGEALELGDIVRAEHRDLVAVPAQQLPQPFLVAEQLRRWMRMRASSAFTGRAGRGRLVPGRLCRPAGQQPVTARWPRRLDRPGRDPGPAAGETFRRRAARRCVTARSRARSGWWSSPALQWESAGLLPSSSRATAAGSRCWRAARGDADHKLPRDAVDGQHSDEPLPPDRQDNLYQPVPGDDGVHGRFDDEATAHSTRLWMTTHRGRIAAGAALLATAAGALATLRRR